MQNGYSSHYAAIRSSMYVKSDDGTYHSGKTFRKNLTSEINEKYTKNRRYYLIASTVALVVTSLVLLGFIIVITINELATNPTPSVVSSLVTIGVTESNQDSVFNIKTTYIVWPLVIVVLALSIMFQVVFFLWKCTASKIGCGECFPEMAAKDDDDEPIVETLFLSTDRYQWVSNTICLPLVFWITAAIAGVSDLYLLITVFGLGVWVTLSAGLFHEWINASLFVLVFYPKGTRSTELSVKRSTNWWYFITAIVPFTIYWVIILVHLIARLCPSSQCLTGDKLDPYWYVITWVAAMMVLSISSLLAVIVHYRSVSEELLVNISERLPSKSDIIEMNLNYAIAKLIITGLMKLAPAILLIIVVYV